MKALKEELNDLRFENQKLRKATLKESLIPITKHSHPNQKRELVVYRFADSKHSLSEKYQSMLKKGLMISDKNEKKLEAK